MGQVSQSNYCIYAFNLQHDVYRERATMNDTKGKDVNEVVLSDDSGNLYEGMTSNFFVVKTRDDGQSVVVCAPLEHILLGTVMKIVMRVCERHQIPIEWTCPQLWMQGIADRKDASLPVLQGFYCP